MNATVVEIREVRSRDVILHPVTGRRLRVWANSPYRSVSGAVSYDLWVAPVDDFEEYFPLYHRAPGHKLVNRVGH